MLLAVVLPALICPVVAVAQTPPTDAFGDDAQVSKDIEEILAGPDFRRLRARAPTAAPQENHEFKMPAWLEKFLRWLADLFSRAGSAFSALGALLQALAYGILAAICALIIWLVVKAVNRYRERQRTGGKARRSAEEGEADIPPGDLPADEYLKRAA
jgi:hypothetical protein